MEHTLPVIVATVVLHNIAVIMGDVVPADDQELSAYVQHRRAVGPTS
jgi:carbonic anhydrase/acetyltransferase-like protein (isoleucine patch superfamily)